MSRPATARAKAAEINALWDGGMKPHIIAKELGISLASVYRYLDRPRRSPYIRAIAAEANRRIKAKKKAIGSRNFALGLPELLEDYNPTLATDEETIDIAMSSMGEDMTSWRNFKNSVLLQLAARESAREMASLPKSERRRVEEFASQPMSGEEIDELRRQRAWLSGCHKHRDFSKWEI